MSYEKDLIDRAEYIQQECHNLIKEIIRNAPESIKMTTQDATNVFLFKKLAEIELSLRGLHESVGFLNRRNMNF